ncbi:fimbrial biogenesis chaperone [Paraburkholderia dinghuensis]|uniref:Molecular chaperone n=1 Tax=Paraburkholderia dinghuensis TaxID=2305225 RepID=A0A3N6NEW2_9BURK|nr:molecular chaperone [Paraburkholderia dinghuensis]RQH07117.1 molecular chaperone [Paraburkholderia dinghuensis]
MRNIAKWMKSCCAGLLLALLLTGGIECLAGESLGAGIFTSSTRLIFPSTSRDASLQIFNENDYPVIIQTWIDDGDENALPDELETPFVVIPPLIRLQPHESRAVRIIYTQHPLPEDKESVFWFNAQMIPPMAHMQTDQKNEISLSVRLRQKIFFRPRHIDKGSEEWADKLDCRAQFHQEGEAIINCRNPTPYYATLDKISLHTGNETLTETGSMLAPFSDKSFHLKDSVSVGTNEGNFIELSIIDDEGFVRKIVRNLN